MNILTAALAALLTLGGAIPGPLHVVEWHARLMIGDQTVELPLTADGQVVPLPPPMTKAGWLCVLNKRAAGKNVITQSILCSYKEATFGATTVCRTNGPDVDLQRVSISDERAKDFVLGIVLACRTAQAVGADL